jgi:MerR family transcriptional regulator, aldehyde-responsive regulator
MDLTIKDMAKKLGVSVYTLRYYEKENIILDIERKANGHRVYKEEDLGKFDFLTCLKSTGMSISDMKKYVTLCKSSESNINERVDLLRCHKKKIQEKIKIMNSFLEKIDWKINYYSENTK